MGDNDTSCVVARGRIGEDLRLVGLRCPLHSIEGTLAQLGAPSSPPLAAATFLLGCVSGAKPNKRDGVKCFMVTVVIYLILLSAGIGLLVMKGKAVWALCGPSASGQTWS